MFPNTMTIYKLKLETMRSCFTCAACGEDGDGYPYVCHDECNLRFHVNCEKYEAEVTHSSHSFHPLVLIKNEPPTYSDGECCFCGEKLVHHEVFYHCSTCNFSLDLPCVMEPPPIYLNDINIHDHKVNLMAKLISFTCTICGLPGDRSPYVCIECNFTSHNDCSGFPWVININRHNHRVSRTPLLGVVNSVCGVCQKKMDWSCGGYLCKRCPPGNVYHTKCATRKDVSDGIEMRYVPEEDEDIESFKKIDEDTIQHYSHKEHYLGLDESGMFIEETWRCAACAYPIYHDSFYGCTVCDFILHKKCAELPTQKRHVLSTKPYILRRFQNNYSRCEACGVFFNGFVYGNRPSGLDVRCASVSRSFLHQSHKHPLFYTSPEGVCSACKKAASHVLRCVDVDCQYALDFKCALVPYEVKHRVDDHFLSLCYGEDDASGKYWCDICEKETNPNGWFYTCKEDCGVTLHVDCVLGDFRGLIPARELTSEYKKRTTYLTIRNNSMSRPLCGMCNSRCIYPTILKSISEPLFHDVKSHIYHCSIKCCGIETVKILFGPVDYDRSVRIESS